MSTILGLESSQVCESGSCRAFNLRDGEENWMSKLKLKIEKGSLRVRDQIWNRGKKIIGSCSGGRLPCRARGLQAGDG